MRTIGVLLPALLLFGLTAGIAAAQDTDSTATADSLLIRELAREMAAGEGAPKTYARGSTARAAASTNPDISVIGDARARYVSEGQKNVDAGLNEAEFAFRSVVDPYARADFYISVHDTGFGHHEHGEEEPSADEEHAGEETGHEGGFAFELEEAYLTTLSLPGRLQGRIGKFRTQIGRINTVHPHALPFIDTPAVYENFFGAEGLNDQGIDVSWLLPHDAFYQELTVTAHRGPVESASFTRSEDNRLLWAAHLRNFWDLGRNSTLDIGLSGLSGVNTEDEKTLIGGLDVTYIWKPVQFNTYRSLTLQSELFASQRTTAAGDEIEAMGMYSMASWQLARRWFVTGRYDFSELPDDASWDQNGLSLTFGWYLTEFQKLEAGGVHAWGDSVESTWSAVFRLVFVIGSHGAHEY